ncbi:MAG TPA: hypothetical protein VGO59_04395 [Verrucomicrobiae bacterium]|jgi:hypothetical protein
METKNREKLLLMATGVVAGLWLLNLLVISPLIDSWHSRSAEIAKLKQNIDSGGVLVRREETIRNKWDDMRANALANNPTVAERQLFSAFDHWVTTGRVTEGSFRPQFQEGDSNFTTVDCRSDITGNLTGVSDFLRAMAKDPLADKVESFELNSKDDDGRQLALALSMSGLILTDSDPTTITPAPKPDTGGSATNLPSDAQTALFDAIALNNIFDQSRVYRTPGSRPIEIVHRTYSISADGVASDNGKAIALFEGDGVSTGKEYKVGDSVADFKLTDIALNTVTLTNASNTFNLPADHSASLRRQDDGPWTMLTYIAPPPPPADTNAASATASKSNSSTDSVEERLRKRRESE